MAIQFSNRELQLKLKQWAAQTGRPADELVENVMAGYFDELAGVLQTVGTTT